jgi:hypothetical protein
MCEHRSQPFGNREVSKVRRKGCPDRDHCVRPSFPSERHLQREAPARRECTQQKGSEVGSEPFARYLDPTLEVMRGVFGVPQ